MPKLEVALFGRLFVQWADDLTVNIDSVNAQKLFSYLLIFRQHAHRRERLAELLWSDYRPNRARTYLRKALWQLQNALDVGDRDVLLIESDWLQINPDTPLWIDLEVFEQAFRRTSDSRGSSLDIEAVHLLERAVELYRGDLLEGNYDEWCLLERERLLRMYLIILDKLAAYCEAHSLHEAGINYGMLMLRHSKAHEGAHCRLMRLFYASGDRTTALLQYRQCRRFLAEELSVEPAAQTTALYEQIRADRFPSHNEVAALDNVISWHRQLAEIQTAFHQFHEQFMQDIKVVESLLEQETRRG